MIDADEGQRKMFAGHAGSSLAATRRLPVHSPLRCGLPNPHGIWGRNDGGIMVVDLEKKIKTIQKFLLEIIYMTQRVQGYSSSNPRGSPLAGKGECHVPGR